MHSVWQRYDDTGSTSSAHVFTFLMSALNFKHPAWRLCTDTWRGYICKRLPIASSWPHHSLNSVAEVVMTAASATMPLRMIDTEAGLSVQTAAMKVQWCVCISTFCR
jgi:hypothetical protein